jgi:hypothetical protein
MPVHDCKNMSDKHKMKNILFLKGGREEILYGAKMSMSQKTRKCCENVPD